MKFQQTGRPKKRRRVYVVCTECRDRKIRCDRKCPCTHCQKSGLKCEYRAPDGSPLKEETSSETENMVVGAVTTSIGSQLSDIAIGMTQIKERLALMDQQMGNSPRSTASVPHFPVLDTKTPVIKQSTIVSKPSRTLYLGPSSIFNLVFSRPAFGSIFSGLRDIIKKERSAWKTLHPINATHRIGYLLDEAVGEDSVVEMINTMVCPYYLAFDELLVYFQNNLNRLLFTGLIPMNLIRSLYVSYFRGVPQFARLNKCYCYADISAIVAVAYIVLIFTRHTEITFQHQLPASADDLSNLALQLLNVSQFRRKKTHLALVSIVVLRAGLFAFDNADRITQELDSYPMFQMCLDLCYQMGVHSNQDTTRLFVLKNGEELKGRNLSRLELKRLWNYMQIEDAVSSLVVGTPLLINYEFSEEYRRSSELFFEVKREEGLLLMRKSTVMLNSRKATSVRDILNVYTEILSFCNQFPASMFAPGGSYENLDELAYLFKQKLFLLQVLQSICGMIIAKIVHLERSRSLYDHDTTVVLANLSKEMNRQLLISGAALLYQTKSVLDGKTAFGTDKNGKYMVFFKGLFGRSSAQAFITWFTLVLPRATKNSELVGELRGPTTTSTNYPPKENGYLFDIDLTVLERALFHEFNGEDGSQLGERLSTRLMSSEELMSFASSFYDSMCQIEIMKGSLDCFLTLKSVIVWLYIVRTVEEYSSALDSGKMTVADVIKKARAKVENDFITGGLDDRNLAADGYDLDRLFDSLFEQDWLGMTSDFDVGSLFGQGDGGVGRDGM